MTSTPPPTFFFHSLDAVAMACRSHQRPSLLDGGRRIRLVAEPFTEFLLRCCELRERIDEAPDHHWRHILDDLHQHRLVQHQVHGSAHPRIVERLSPVVYPGRLER